MSKNYDYLFKILMIGDSSVGKTSLLHRLCENSFNANFISTIGIDFKMHSLEVDNKKIKLQIWDTAGQERFRTITTAYYRGAMGILVVFDLCNRNTFENLISWINAISEHSSTEALRIIVGNKSDEESSRVITTKQATDFASLHGAKYIEVSAKTGKNVNEAFSLIARLIRDQMNTKLSMEPSLKTITSDAPINLTKKSSLNGSSSCC